MHTALLHGVPKSEVESVKGFLKKLVADPAMEYVRRSIRLQYRNSRYSDFDSPSWAYKQAYQNGYNSALDDVLKLIEDKG